MEKLYTATVTASDGRLGTVKSNDGELNLSLNKPTGLGGKDDKCINPEQLFAAAYSACFGSALDLAATRSDKTIGPITVTAEVTIGKNDGNGFELGINIAVNVADVTQELAEELVKQAHEICPYSGAIRGNIDVGFTVSSHNV